jgi:hypothetical protein
MANSYVDPITLAELLRRTDDQYLLLVDNPADIVGDPSGGEGGVRAPLENDDFQLGVVAFGLGSGAHPGGIPPDNDESFFFHVVISNELPTDNPAPVSVHFRITASRPYKGINSRTK